MSVSLSQWREAQAEIRGVAQRVARGEEAPCALLQGWPVRLSEAAAAALIALPEPPATEDMARLVGWCEAEDLEDGPPRPQSAWDQLAASRPSEGTPERRRVAALTLLGRLGWAYRRREHEAPEARSWTPSPNDAALARSWTALLTGPPQIQEGGPLHRAAQGVVRASFQGVAAVLRLPPEVSRELAARALEQLDIALPLARGELAAWVVETRGEPIGALARSMGPAAWERVRACVAGRALWAEVGEALGGLQDRDDLAGGAAAAVLRRVCAGLGEGRAVPHELGLPAWGVVASNRSRIRGRLRAAAQTELPALARALEGLTACSARTADALGRFSWGWAWREARASFGMDLDRIGAPACTVGPPLQERAPPLGPAEEPALRTLMLLIAGRGCWEDLERWVEGGVGRELDRGFYRCLDAAPDALADPSTGRRARSYERLRAWLFEGGLEAGLAVLAEVAEAVRPLPVGRDLRASMQRALSPWWDESAISFPQHHLPGFREALLDVRFSSGPPRTPPGSRR